MLSIYEKIELQNEIKYNFKKLYWHTKFMMNLLGRYIKKSVPRSTSAVYDEYNQGWEKFWEHKSYFSNKKFPFVDNRKLIEPMISPFEYQKKVTDKIIGDYIKRYKFKRVLEIGSGTGLHLLNLGAMFPEVEFFGLELTKSGVEISNKLLEKPPVEFQNAYELGMIKNVKIIHGSILDKKVIQELKNYDFDLIFTTTVLEQLHNYLDVAFENIFSLKFSHFLFHEQWLELNAEVRQYALLIENDYFRASLETLNKYPAKLIETILPSIQPMGMNLAVAFGEKTGK